MYQPPHFREDRLEVQHGLIRAHPLGLLVTAGPGGLMANAIPFTLETTAGPHGLLRAHLARANSQWREFDGTLECMVLFQGPDSYITPSWYASKAETHKVVPTWNYAMVHAWGTPSVHDDATWLRRQIGQLTLERERSRATPWAVSDAPEAFIDGQMRGIVGIEMPITRIEGKWKVSQNRPEADIAGVHAGLVADQGVACPMANLVAERGGLGTRHKKTSA